MRRGHFEAIQPICPVCRVERRGDNQLFIGRVLRECGSNIIEGFLHCPQVGCQREYPILDGIPIIVGPLRTYISENILPVFGRNDLSEELESLLGDCCGPGSSFDLQRQIISTYADGHYADLNSADHVSDLPEGSIVRTLREIMAIVPPRASGMTIDVGCSVGRTTFELAEHSNDLVLGVDLNFAMLRLASQILQTGRISYSRRRIGIVYDRQEFSYSPDRADHVDFWACDALVLPFKPQTFSFGVAFNLLDCVSSPVDLLKSISSILSPHGKLVLTTPFDWSAAATSVEAWIGGHSQRTPAKGMSETSLRALISAGPAVGLPEMTILAERDSITWDVRLHDRAVVSYRMHLMIAEKAGPAPAIPSKSQLDD
jgi:SAM-dependent methyltransferase/uncharacterized protein YbaR (Trm112 family)